MKNWNQENLKTLGDKIAAHLFRNHRSPQHVRVTRGKGYFVILMSLALRTKDRDRVTVWAGIKLLYGNHHIEMVILEPNQ